MARGGINKAIVQKARESLLARGENPSIDAVRIELGNTGSKTTIHRYLKEIEDFDPRPRASRERLSDELTELVAGLLARMTEEGGEAIAHAQGVFDEQRVALEKKYETLNAEFTFLQRQFDSQKAALEAQTEELLICQTGLQTEITRNARLSQNCSDLELRVQEKDEQTAPWKKSTCIHAMRWNIIATRSRSSGSRNNSDTKGRCNKFRLSYDSSSRL
ncbi:DNA-binding protein [Pseudomonas sp. S2_H10]